MLNDAWCRFTDRVTTIPGFYEPRFNAVLRTLDTVQRVNRIGGNLLELGVYHGRSFVPLYLCSQPDEAVIGIDRFAPYVRGEPAPSPEAVERLCWEIAGDAVGTLGDLEFVRADSQEIDSLGLDAVRIAHVDGDHTLLGAAHDLRLVSRVMHRRGVMIVDDFCNAHWPEVTTAVVDFCRASGAVPVCIAWGKIVLCGERHVKPLYHNALLSLLNCEQAVEFLGVQTLFFFERIHMAGIGFQVNTGEVATGTSAKTLAQVVAASNHRLLLKNIRVHFKGTSAGDVPIQVRVLRQTTGGSMTSLTPTKLDSTIDETLQVTAQHTATSEPSAGDELIRAYAHPQGGEFHWAALRDRDMIPVPGGGRVGVEVTAGASVNAVVHVEGEE